MKDSGVEWIGEIPNEWKIERLQWHLKEIVVKNDPIQTKQVLSLTNKKGVIPYEEKGNQGNTAKESYDGYKIAYPDTIVANSMNILIGSVGYSNYYGCVSPVYYVFKELAGNDLRFINYIMQIPQFQKELRRFANGILEIRLRVSAIDILKRPCAFPNYNIQVGIADYLDVKCSKIDAVIAKQETIIEKLKEYKLSIITELVTKGLDLDAKLIESGVEWIGKIPDTWHLSHIGNLVEIGSGGTPDRNKPEYWNGTIPWMASSEINYEYVYETKEYITELGMNNSNTKILPINTVMLGLIGQGKTKGLTAILKVESTCNQNLAYLIPNETVLHYEYLFYCFKAMYYYIRGLVGDSQAGIYQGFLKKQYIPLPPVDIQKSLCKIINNKVKKIDCGINRRKQLIERYNLYKKSLIYEVVTGKKEV